MSRILKYASLGLLSLVMLAPAASAQRGRVRFGGGFGWGGGWGWGPGFGWYAPYYPYWGPYGYYGEGYGPSYPGQVKIITQDKDAKVYVDGGYVGTAEKTKHLRLTPGQHDIELRDSSGKVLHGEHVTVLPGRTVDIHDDTAPPKK